MYRYNILLYLLLNCLSVSAQYKNLVFEGGGIRGIAYAGALQELEKAHTLDSIDNACGTSVGAIVAVLYSLGYNPEEMKDMLFDLKLQQFNDGRWFFIGGQQRFRKLYGWYRGDALEKWIGKAIERKTGSAHTTFAQLHELRQQSQQYADAYITATNLNRQKTVVFSHLSHPQMELKTAVRASISIPLYFSAVFLDSTGQRLHNKNRNHEDIYIDGGLIANYPIDVFDSAGVYNKQTLGLKLERPEQIVYDQKGIAPYDIHTLSNYVAALYNLTIESLNSNNNKSKELGRTVYISTGNIQPKVRRMSAATKMQLFQYGIVGAREFTGSLLKGSK